MPYIKQEDRTKFNSAIDDIVDELTNHNRVELTSVGNLNYVVSSILWELFRKKPSYTLGNNLIGVLECVKQELYRKLLAEYEDIKEKENGTI